MGRQKGKVAVITGGSSELALESAKRFVEEGAYVFITGRRQEQLGDAVKAIGRNVTSVRGGRVQTGRPRPPVRNGETGEGQDRCPFGER